MLLLFVEIHWSQLWGCIIIRVDLFDHLSVLCLHVQVYGWSGHSHGIDQTVECCYLQYSVYFGCLLPPLC